MGVALSYSTPPLRLNEAGMAAKRGGGPALIGHEKDERLKSLARLIVLPDNVRH